MKIVVTGGRGLVGTHLKKYLDAVYLSSKDYDLTIEQEVIRMYEELKPTIVIHLAARVGGIMDNINYPADYFTENVIMNTLLLKYAVKYKVDRFIGILSTCIYPDVSEVYPLTEEMLHNGPPTKTNFGYGYSKRLMGVHIDSINKQYGTKYNYLIPTNLYGEHDKDDVNKSHFITALIKKIMDAKLNNENNITLFGDGTPLRQFMHADDFAKVIFDVIDKEIYESFNVATVENLTIKKMADIALTACNANHLSINWDTSKPNGQYRKDVSVEKLNILLPGFKPLSLFEGIKRIYNDKISK